MMTFYDELKKHDWNAISQRFDSITENDVRRALNTQHPTVDDFQALISPTAEPFLDQMALRSQALTIERFGKTIQLYEPLYLHNYCTNSCVYCGFSMHNKIVRKKLDMQAIEAEALAIKKLGFKHILLVAGEGNKNDIDYYIDAIRIIRPYFAQISIEVQPMDVEAYQRLVQEGVTYVCVYQETYNEERYPIYHPKGLKSNFRYRLETPDRACQAGFKKIGIGALLGLEDWRVDAVFTAIHLKYLEKTYWRTKYSISLPRLRPQVGGYEPKKPITDKQMAMLICAFRILDQHVEISISTRESAKFRDLAMQIGANVMSAGSSTQPGGYVNPVEELEQFTINDGRSPKEMEDAIRAHGYEAVWKDWDKWL